MNGIKEYVFCVLMASAVSGILKNLSLGMKKFEKQIGFVCSLAIIVMIVSPITKMISESGDNYRLLPDLDYGESSIMPDDKDKLIAERYVSECEKSLCQILYQKFGISEEDVSVNASVNEKFEIEMLTFDFYNDIDTSEIEVYLRDLLGAKFQIRRYEGNEKGSF
jgi:hypothetical protein